MRKKSAGVDILNYNRIVKQILYHYILMLNYSNSN